MRSLLLVISLAAAPAFAQESTPDDSPDLFSRGVDTLLRNLLGEVGPALRELRDRIQGFDAYHPPEILPNGDIIIRRKTPLEPGPRADADEGMEI